MIKRCFCIMLLVLLAFCRVQAAAVESVPVGEEGGLEEVPEGWVMIMYLGDEIRYVAIPKGCAIADLWEPETVGGSKFLHWTTDLVPAEEDRDVITKDTVFNKDETLYPVTEATPKEAEDISNLPGMDGQPLWEPETDEPTTERDCYIIYFHTCNGEPDTWYLDMPKNKPIGEDGVYAVDSIEPEYSKHDFLGWYTAEQGGEKVEFTKKTVFTRDMDVYAHWENLVNYEITYMKNYGKGLQAYTTIGYKDSVLESLCSDARRKGYKFSGWYTKPKGGKQIKAGYKMTGNMTLYAHWEKIKVNRVSINRLFGKDRAVMVKYKKQKGVKGYQIQVSTSKRFEKKKTIAKTYSDNKVFTKTVKKLKKGTTYYVRIRAFKKDSTGANVYGKWSKVKKIQTKK